MKDDTRHRKKLFIIVIFFLLILIGILLYQNIFSPKAQAINKLNHIIFLVQNPDPKLVSKHKTTPKELKDDQAIILCGGYHNTQEKIENKNCPLDSLYGLEKAIQQDNITAAQALIIKLWPQVRNGTFNDDGFKRFSLEEAQQLDSQKKFLKFLPRGQSYEGSDIKREAALEIIRLYYVLESLHKK